MDARDVKIRQDANPIGIENAENVEQALQQLADIESVKSL